jgi:hypothetical protein
MRATNSATPEDHEAALLAAYDEALAAGLTPALASAGKGEAFLERIVGRLTAYLREMIDGKRVAPIPPHHP